MCLGTRSYSPRTGKPVPAPGNTVTRKQARAFWLSNVQDGSNQKIACPNSLSNGGRTVVAVCFCSPLRLGPFSPLLTFQSMARSNCGKTKHQVTRQPVSRGCSTWFADNVWDRESVRPQILFATASSPVQHPGLRLCRSQLDCTSRLMLLLHSFGNFVLVGLDLGPQLLRKHLFVASSSQQFFLSHFPILLNNVDLDIILFQPSTPSCCKCLPKCECKLIMYT